VVVLSGVVLDRDTPALNRLTALARWGIGGRVSTGRQWVSWLHIDDFLAIIDRVIADPTLTGVVHATSPKPVRNTDLMRELRHAVHRPPAPPTPAWLVKLGAIVLRTDPALALTGRLAIPAKLTAAGHRFQYPKLPGALTDLLEVRPDSGRPQNAGRREIRIEGTIVEGWQSRRPGGTLCAARLGDRILIT